jgi:HlyD family type I secretion membrane fusion protein
LVLQTGQTKWPLKQLWQKPEPTSRALLEFQSPTASLLALPVSAGARSMLWIMASAVVLTAGVLNILPVNMVVSGSGRVVSTLPTEVIQPLETSIIRSIHVREGQTVRKGELLAELDPTFSSADAGALASEVRSLQAEVARLTAESDGSPYVPKTTDASVAVQMALYGQRQLQYRFQIESFDQKIHGLQSQLTRAQQDVVAFSDRTQIATTVESKRLELERLQVGSVMNRLAAQDQRIEMQRNLTAATSAAERAQRDLNQLIADRDAFQQQWKGQINQELILRSRSLSDAQESLRKAALRRQLVDLRAKEDGIVLSVAKVSVGSVLQSGDQFMTLVPVNSPLEVEARIQASDAGYVQPGQQVAVKFDTFPFVEYGLAQGVVRSISADSFTGSQETQRGSVGAQDSHAVWYRARIGIEEANLHGVPGGFQMKPGMPITADIKAGERTLLKYILARVLPVALEGMREP